MAESIRMQFMSIVKEKTHWSVTKAYNSLQLEAEEGKAGENFTFNPLPAEVLSKLFRVVSKTRSDKNKKKKNNQDGDTSDEEGSASRKAGAKQKHSSLERKPSVRVGAQGRRRCALVVRRSNQGSTSEIDGTIAHSGKHSVLAWMIDLGTVSLDGKVHYKNHHEAGSVLEGSITRDGIHCFCCKEIISVSDFENHAGSKLCQPYENIYLESGSSLLQCLLDSWNKQDETGRLGFHGVNVNVDDPNDDTCAICGDGGDLMCCDGCPSTFHLDCLDIEELPLGEWHCVFCSCKFCGVGGESATATEEVESDTVSSQLVTCTFCEEKYHISCISEEDNLSAKSRRLDFCGRNCEQMSERLKSLLGVKCDLGDGYSWTLLQRSDFKEDSVILESQKIQNNSKLAVALSVMEECFLPIIDLRSGVNLIRHVIYSCGSNFNRLNFSSFLTVVLEKGDEVISAASIRIRGKQLAEMPFIGTRNVYRRKGMCRRLLAAIGQALGTLEIENLVIPAITELMNTWTLVFGFNPLEESVREEMRSKNMLVFAHTDMLQKPIVKQQFGEKSTSFIEKDADSGVSQNYQIDCPAVKTDADKPEIDDGCLNGKFDLNCVAPNAPDSSSDEKCLVHPDSDAENCEDNVKRRMNYGDDKNDDGRTGASDIVMNSSELRTLHPDLNLMAENESFSDEKSHGCHGPDTMNFDEVAKSTSNSSGLTNVKECCTVESDDDQNGDSTSVRSSEEKALKYDLNLEGKFLEDDDSLPSNSRSVGAPISRLDGQKPIDHMTKQADDNLLEVTNCCSSQNLDGETGLSGFPAGGQVSEIKCSEVETSKAHDLGSNTGDLTAGAELLTKSTKCSESNSLVVCTRVAQVTSESSCNLSSAAGESCVAGVFHGSGIAKVGPTKS
ncbi:increased DNA methylation 1-like isoform X1 [Chenopodium quinoa]|uniref:increased DNA methylation 1-like isoform X1 n=1 Tax=Chenopodium quinoa TaxID=63459 RepID=UPI000B777AF1|nr:increased DNA methylation 1-like isoform X1 [Chenopodium quinoa]